MAPQLDKTLLITILTGSRGGSWCQCKWVAYRVAADGNTRAIGISFGGADLAHNLGVRDFFAAFWRNIFVVNYKEGVSAFDTLVSTVRVGADALVEEIEFIGVQRAPDLLILGVLEELPVS